MVVNIFKAQVFLDSKRSTEKAPIMCNSQFKWHMDVKRRGNTLLEAGACVECHKNLCCDLSVFLSS